MIKRILNFKLPLNLLNDATNWYSDPSFDAIAERLIEIGAPLEFICVDHVPDAKYPIGIPYPLFSAKHIATADVVKIREAYFRSQQGSVETVHLSGQRLDSGWVYGSLTS